MDEHKRVVITGIGMINPCGGDYEAVLSAVESGRSGLTLTPAEMTAEIVCPYYGRIDNFDPARFLKNKKTAKFMGRDSMLGIYAAGAAIRDARLENDSIFQQNAGVYVSSGLTYGTLGDIMPAVADSIADKKFSLETFGKRSLYKCNPLLSFKILTNMPASFISIEFGLKGPNLIFNPHPAQGAQAVGEAREAVRSGALDFAVAGSAESRLHYAAIRTVDEISGVYKGGAVQEKPSMPFSEDRSGVIPSEGAAFVVMESLESALERKAFIYAEIIAYSQTNLSPDAGNMDAAVSQLECCMADAVESAGITPADLDIVVSSAASSIKKDAFEGRALEKFLKNTQNLIFTPKYYYGEMGAPSFATAFAMGALFIKKKLSPRPAEVKNREFNINHSGYSLVNKNMKYAMINAFEAGLTAVCIIIKGVQ